MSEKKAEAEMWIVVQFGELWAHAFSEQGALDAARESVDQAITDHWKHKLPLQVTEEIARSFDVRVYRCDASCQVALPFQKWVDENYKHRQEVDEFEKDREYRRFLELREKYEERLQKEASDAVSRLPNCS